ncbi:hypothetical protein F0U62_47835 [Cystobacter fuscus]|uniref:hypothetical protein n=1 Tax=Cystobacter fuscus TaxID=43 RepID=UPI002B31CCA5|nr:hypothetical protein F0U62_47835 [Cystobacter fuscus]
MSSHKTRFSVPAAKKSFQVPAAKKPGTTAQTTKAGTKTQTNKQPASSRTLYVIGSPAPGEVKAKHPFQFVEAAVYRGLDSNTLCLVEKTGFEKAKVDLKEVERKLAPATVQWITPQETLVKALNKLTVNSIRRLIGFSHGLPGIVTLRYGWEGSTNYGLAPSEISTLRKDVFTADAELELNSCNTGSYSDGGTILAQNLATHVNRPVKAWTGRTSYREVNDGSGDGDTSIQASDASRGGSRLTLGWDTTELWRQVWEGRGAPQLVTYKPLDEFQSDFKLHSSIPEGEHTVCAATGTSLEVTVDSARYSSHSVHKANGMLYITPFRRDPALGDVDESLGTKPFRVGTRQTQTWSGLTGGWYYLQLTKDNSKAFLGYETIEGSLTARIKG